MGNIMRQIVLSTKFSNFIYSLIIVNAVLMGIQTFYTAAWIIFTQNAILTVYVIELFIRWFGRRTVKEYFTDGWNYFDIFVVIISFIPTAGALTVLRSFRILRVFRALKTIPELRIIGSVLIKSITSLSYTGIFFGIFLYVYAVIGVTLFKFKDYAGSAYEAMNNGYPDPYGNLSEAYFTLFRILTGEDWTDLRYILLKYSDHSDFIVTTYHVSWMILSAFLLINLVVGAIINNYEQVMGEEKVLLDKQLKNDVTANLIK